MQTPSSTRDVLPTVVLGCAKDDRLLLPPMLEGLVAAGFEVEVASGLESRGDPLLAAATRLREAAFVLLVSAELPALLTDQLRTKLMHAGVPGRRIVAIAIDEANGAIDVAERLAAAGIVASHVRRPTSVRLGAVHGLSESSGTRPTTFIGVVPAIPDARASGFPPPAPPRQTMHAPLSGSVPVLDVELEADVLPGRRRKLAIAAATAAALGLVFVIAASRSTPEPTAQDVTQVKESWASLYERARDHVAPAPEAAPAVAAPAVVAVASPVIVPVPVPAPAEPEVVIAVPEEPKPVADTPPPPPLAAEPVDDEAPRVDEVEIQSIYAGLVGQKFRALDILLVSPEPRKKKGKRVYKTPAKMAWKGAQAYCEKLEIDGVADWRLPGVGELGSLTSGELLPEGKFWSQTEGDTFGRSRVVWNTKSAKMGTAPVRWTGGRVVCVRTLAKAPTLPTK